MELRRQVSPILFNDASVSALAERDDDDDGDDDDDNYFDDDNTC